MVNFSIILPTAQRFAMLKVAVESIRKNSVNKNHEIIVPLDTVVKSSNRLFLKSEYKEWIEIKVNPPTEKILDFLREKNCVILDPKELGDHYRMTNYASDFCSNDYIILGHNNIYFMERWDLAPIELIEARVIEERNFICPNALPDHAELGGIYMSQIIQDSRCNTFMSYSFDGDFHLDEQFLNSFCRCDQTGYIRENPRVKHWVCPLILHKNLFNKVGRYDVRYLMPHSNDLSLDIELHKIGDCFVPNGSFIWHH